MSIIDYKFGDFINFLSDVDNGNMDFAMEVHEKLLQMGCKVKITSTKAYPYQLAYTMPNSRKGILNFYLRKKSLKVRITITDPEKHSDVLNSLSEKMLSQMDKKDVCRKIVEGCKCLDSCTGFDFHIGETHYQKCRFQCFQFDVDTESIPFFFQLLEREIKVRYE